MSNVDLILFQITPIGLYIAAALVMSIGVMPRVVFLFMNENEYKEVALLMLIITVTQFFTSIAALLFLYCFLFQCSIDESPYRGAIRTVIALNFFSSAVGFLTLYYLEPIKNWLHGRKK